jgi:hypothetical protein
MYVANLKKYLNTVSKKLYAEGIALTLDRVVRETIKDSGRAAANWNISFGSVGATASWDPENYGQAFNNGAGSVGQRGDKGQAPIASYKAYHYGYTSDGNSVTVIPHGRIHQAIKPGVGGAAPAAIIYNPIFSGESERNIHYTKNAFKATISHETMKVSIESDLAGKIPKIIHDTAMELRFPVTFKR